jgi:uncharacterized membrane protein YbhN (UPF0104 family)
LNIQKPPSRTVTNQVRALASSIPRPAQLSSLTRRAGRYVVLLVLLGLAVHLILPQITTLEHSLQVIERMTLWAVALAPVAQVLSYLSSGYLLQAVVAIAGQRLSIIRGALIAMAASSIGLVAGGPVGNAAATYRWAHGSGVSKEGALLAGWLPSLFNNSLLILISASGLLHLLIAHALSTFQAIGFGVILLILAVIVGGALWGVHHRPQLTALAMWVAGRWATLRRRPYDPMSTQAAVGRLFSAWDALQAGGWHKPAIGSILNVGSDILTLYLIFLAAGHAVSPGVLLAGYGLPLLLGKMSFLPGGVGVVEGTMAALYDGLGVPDAVTVVVILVYRAISFWMPTLLGFPLVPYLQHISGSSKSSEGGP